MNSRFTEKKKILIIYPQGNALNMRGGVEARIWNVISSLISNDFNVSILHAKKSKGHEDKQLKKKCIVYYYKGLNFFGAPDTYLSDLNPFFIIKLYKIVRKQKFDIIQIEFPWGFLITKLLAKKNSILIYDSQNVECEFVKIAHLDPRFPKIFKPLSKQFAKIYEKLTCKLANVIINVSEADRNYYIQNYNVPKNKTILIQTPTSLNINKIVRSESLKLKFRKRLGLPLNKTIVMFHGSLPHPPNKQAFDIINNFIAPKIRNPNIIFVLAGHNLQKYKRDNVLSIGFVNDLEDLLYSADFAIVPILTGGGMRTKCMDYIITGLPFITTKKGIEGIDFLEPGKDYLVYDKIDREFIESINLLYKNKEIREKLHKNLSKKTKPPKPKKFAKTVTKI